MHLHLKKLAPVHPVTRIAQLSLKYFSPPQFLPQFIVVFHFGSSEKNVFVLTVEKVDHIPDRNTLVIQATSKFFMLGTNFCRYFGVVKYSRLLLRTDKRTQLRNTNRSSGDIKPTSYLPRRQYVKKNDDFRLRIECGVRDQPW